MQLPGDISTCGAIAGVFAQPRPTAVISGVEIPHRGRPGQRHGPSFIANETVLEPRALNCELLWSVVLESFPEGLAPPAGREAAAPAGPGAGERLGCGS